MGTLHYGAPSVGIPIDDRALAHLELVIVAKLRRREGFSFVTESEAGTRHSLWLSSGSALRFEYEGAMPEINRQWLQELADAASSPGGLKVLPEPTVASR